MTKEQLENLLAKFLAGDITADEKTALEKWVSSNEGQNIFQYVQHEEWVKKGIAELDKVDSESAYAKFITQYNNISSPQGSEIRSPDGFQKKRWQWLAAAAIAAVVCSGSFYLYSKSTPSAKKVKKEQGPRDQNNILPGSNTATLQLSDGRIIQLNQSAPGLLAEEAAVKVQKTADDQLVYKPMAKPQGKTEYYNTISTSAGGQYRLVLPDGSKVWLNAGSSIRFPVSFTGKERRVTVSGEVFFDVAGINSMPFIVNVQKNNTATGEIQVTGTRFNVNAYYDEGFVRTTVLEGRIRVVPSSASSRTIQLNTGQQAAYTGDGNFQISSADTGSVAGWLQGKFIFQNEPIQSIMRQLGRWYNVDIIFRDEMDARFVASFPRNMQLSDLLRILEKTNIIRFEIRDKTVIVMR